MCASAIDKKNRQWQKQLADDTEGGVRSLSSMTSALVHVESLRVASFVTAWSCYHGHCSVSGRERATGHSYQTFKCQTRPQARPQFAFNWWAKHTTVWVLEFFIVSRAARACMCRGTPGSVSWSKPQPREEEARGRPSPLGQWGPPRAVSCPLALKLQHGASPSWAACHVLCHCREKRTNSTSCVRCCSVVDFDYFFKTLRCFERENFAQLFRHWSMHTYFRVILLDEGH